jgi:hypothetical protein
MTLVYEYNGYTLRIAAESDFRAHMGKRKPGNPGYVAVVRIFEVGSAVSRFAPLRLGESAGHSFASEREALDGGYCAARTIVDDLFR